MSILYNNGNTNTLDLMLVSGDSFSDIELSNNDKYTELKNSFNIIETKSLEILNLSNKLSNLRNETEINFKNYQAEKAFILQQRSDILSSIKAIFGSGITSLFNSTNNLASGIINSLNCLVDDIMNMDNECIKQEEEIISNNKELEELKLELSNKYADLELIKIRSSASSFLSENESLSDKNEKINNSLLEEKLVSVVARNQLGKDDISRMSDELKLKDDEINGLRDKREEDKEKFNQLILELKVNLATQEQKLQALRDKVSKYKDQIVILKQKVDSVKCTTDNYKLYSSMFPVFLDL